MPFELISFDLQGTISDTEFSDTFWMELLPALYAEKEGVSFSDAKIRLKKEFHAMGRYDRRYYSFDWWMEQFGIKLDWTLLRALAGVEPRRFPDMEKLVKDLHKRNPEIPLLLFSATSHDFIREELGELRSAFTWIVSAIDDLGIAGKPPEAFRKVASLLKIEPKKILHIGDDIEMDVENSRAAGWYAYWLKREQNKGDKSHAIDDLYRILLDHL